MQNRDIFRAGIATPLWRDVRSTQSVIKMQHDLNDAIWLRVSRTDNVRASEDRPIVGDEAGAYDDAVRIQNKATSIVPNNILRIWLIIRS